MMNEACKNYKLTVIQLSHNFIYDFL